MKQSTLYAEKLNYISMSEYLPKYRIFMNICHSIYLKKKSECEATIKVELIWEPALN